MAMRAYNTPFEREGARAMDARNANDRIAEKAEQLRFVSRVPMLCECSEPSCRAIVMIGLGDYRALRRNDGILTAPGHSAGLAEDSDGDRRSA
jgi:hypothetical protein